jgi:hypothetical protein
MKNEQQMLEEAYQGIEPCSLTAHEVDLMEEEWLTRQKQKAAIDEVHRLTRPRNRKVPHEI